MDNLDIDYSNLELESTHDIHTLLSRECPPLQTVFFDEEVNEEMTIKLSTLEDYLNEEIKKEVDYNDNKEAYYAEVQREDIDESDEEEEEENKMDLSDLDLTELHDLNSFTQTLELDLQKMNDMDRNSIVQTIEKMKTKSNAKIMKHVHRELMDYDKNPQ